MRDSHNLKVLHFDTRKDWRSWLLQNHRQESEAWLVYPKKATGKIRIPYNDAVEEALCFGWIDSTVRSFDKNHTMQRFTPRRSGSKYSQPNRERIRWLLQHDLVHPDYRKALEEEVATIFEFPADIIRHLQKDKTVWQNYQALTPGYRRIRIAYIDSARKRPEEFQKRLQNFISMTRANKMIRGFGGIEKYY